MFGLVSYIAAVDFFLYRWHLIFEWTPFLFKFDSVFARLCLCNFLFNFSLIVLQTFILMDNCPFSEASCQRNVLSANCPVGDMSCQRAVPHVGYLTCKSVNCPVGELFCRRNVCRRTYRRRSVRVPYIHMQKLTQSFIWPKKLQTYRLYHQEQKA